MRLLFIAPADLGESVLATGVLAWALAQMEALSVTIVCTPEAATLFRSLPGLHEVRPWRGRGGVGGALAQARGLRGERFDLVLDLSGAGLARLVRAERRVMARRPGELRHRLEDWAALVGADIVQPPKIWLDERAHGDAAAFVAPMIALAPGADAVGKRWLGERFAAVARRLASGSLAQASVVLLGGAEDGEITHGVAQSLDADGVSVRNLTGKLDLLAQAALLQRATLFIGNDNAQLHLAAAMSTPALGLFGPTDERIRGPLGARTRALRGRAYEAAMASHDPLEDGAAMRDLSVDVVEAAAADLLHAGGLG